jgi:beta-lactamase class A
MMTISDNTATNLLIKRIGFDAVNATIAECGMTATRLTKYVGVSLPAGAGPSRTTPADMLRMLELLATGQVVSPAACEAMLHTMSMNRHHHGVTRYIDDYDDELEPEQVKVRVYSKSGWFRTVRNDVAVIRAPRSTYVLAMFSKDCKDESYKPDNEAAILLPRVSKAIYKEWGI